MLNIVRVLDEMARAGRQPPKLVAISVVGVGKSAQHLPLVYKVSSTTAWVHLLRLNS
jgi:hypothetical protein